MLYRPANDEDELPCPRRPHLHLHPCTDPPRDRRWFHAPLLWGETTCFPKPLMVSSAIIITRSAAVRVERKCSNSYRKAHAIQTRSKYRGMYSYILPGLFHLRRKCIYVSSLDDSNIAPLGRGTCTGGYLKLKFERKVEITILTNSSGSCIGVQSICAWIN